jgi:hypothetical protein
MKKFLKRIFTRPVGYGRRTITNEMMKKFLAEEK